MPNATLYTEMTLRDTPDSTDSWLWAMTPAAASHSVWMAAVSTILPFALHGVMWEFEGNSPKLGGSVVKSAVKLDGDIMTSLYLLAEAPAICAYSGSDDAREVATDEADLPYWTLDGPGIALYKSVALNMLNTKYDERQTVSMYKDTYLYNLGDHKEMLGVCATPAEAKLYAKKSRVWTTPLSMSFARSPVSGLRVTSMMLTPPKLSIALNARDAIVVNPNATEFPNIGVRPDGVRDDEINAFVTGSTGPRKYRIRPLCDTDIKVRMYATFAVLGEEELKEMNEKPHTQFVSQVFHDEHTVHYTQCTSTITPKTQPHTVKLALNAEVPVQSISVYVQPANRAATGRVADYKGVYDPVSDSWEPAIKEFGVYNRSQSRWEMMPREVYTHVHPHAQHPSGLGDGGVHVNMALAPTADDNTGAAPNMQYLKYDAKLTLNAMIFKEEGSCGSVNVLIVTQGANVATHSGKVLTMAL